MSFLRTKTCCFCSSVETGTKIIAVLGIVSGVIGLVGAVMNLHVGNIISNGINLAVSAMLLHGLKRRRPAFVLAWLVVDGIGLVLCALFTVLFLLFWIYLAAGDNKELCDKMAEAFRGVGMSGSTEEISSAVAAMTGAFFFLMLIITLLSLYFFAVVYSFYKDLQEELFTNGGQVVMRKVEEGGDGYGYGGGYPPQQQKYMPQQQQQQMDTGYYSKS